MRSYIDESIARTKGIPGILPLESIFPFKDPHPCAGPSAYGAPKLPPPGGGKFSTAVAKSDIDWMVYRAKSMPGPGQYGNPVLKENLGGKFNLSNPKSDVDWMVRGPTLLRLLPSIDRAAVFRSSRRF
jgi:hypothetical protein